jgi:ribulose 1,5-bisphosphate synthetase/thiazole synthase
MSPEIPLDVDVAVIGGGPAGSTAATLLAQQGVRAGRMSDSTASPVHTENGG